LGTDPKISDRISVQSFKNFGLDQDIMESPGPWNLLILSIH